MTLRSQVRKENRLLLWSPTASQPWLPAKAGELFQFHNRDSITPFRALASPEGHGVRRRLQVVPEGCPKPSGAVAMNDPQEGGAGQGSPIQRRDREAQCLLSGFSPHIQHSGNISVVGRHRA